MWDTVSKMFDVTHSSQEEAASVAFFSPFPVSTILMLKKYEIISQDLLLNFSFLCSTLHLPLLYLYLLQSMLFWVSWQDIIWVMPYGGVLMVSAVTLTFFCCGLYLVIVELFCNFDKMSHGHTFLLCTFPRCKYIFSRSVQEVYPHSQLPVVICSSWWPSCHTVLWCSHNTQNKMQHF